MTPLPRILRRKAAKAALRHSAHGVAAKVQRRPLRSTSLLSAGLLLGAAAGWLARSRTVRGELPSHTDSGS